MLYESEDMMRRGTCEQARKGSEWGGLGGVSREVVVTRVSCVVAT